MQYSGIHEQLGTAASDRACTLSTVQATKAHTSFGIPTFSGTFRHNRVHLRAEGIPLSEVLLLSTGVCEGV